MKPLKQVDLILKINQNGFLHLILPLYWPTLFHNTRKFGFKNFIFFTFSHKFCWKRLEKRLKLSILGLDSSVNKIRLRILQTRDHSLSNQEKSIFEFLSLLSIISHLLPLWITQPFNYADSFETLLVKRMMINYVSKTLLRCGRRPICTKQVAWYVNTLIDYLPKHVTPCK